MRRFWQKADFQADSDRATDDESLLLAAAQGNLNAFNELVMRHERVVYNLCYRMLGTAQEAEDATQDTFLKAWQAAKSFRGGVVRPWLMRIATNRCYDKLRSRTRYPVDSLATDEDGSIEIPLIDPDNNADPVARYEALELSESLQACLDQLQPDQRIAVLLCDVHKYSYDEAATILGVPIGTVKSRAFRGRERLRDILSSNPHTRELISPAQRSL